MKRILSLGNLIEPINEIYSHFYERHRLQRHVAMTEIANLPLQECYSLDSRTSFENSVDFCGGQQLHVEALFVIFVIHGMVLNCGCGCGCCNCGHCVCCNAHCGCCGVNFYR